MGPVPQQADAQPHPTIARANRVYRDSGPIVDYVGVFRNLEKALAIYGMDGTVKGERGVDEKAALEDAIEETRTLCAEQGVDLRPIEGAGGFERVGLLDDAEDGLVASDEPKKRFLDQAAYVDRLYKAVLPDPTAWHLHPGCSLTRVLAEKIRGLSPRPTFLVSYSKSKISSMARSPPRGT